MQLKERLYNDEEKGALSGNRYPLYKGYSALFEQYGKDECYRDFFNKLAVEGNNILFYNKKFSVLTAGHNGTDIFSGGFKDRNGDTGLPGVVYMSGIAAMEQAAKQGKKLFATRKEANSFIQQFP
jgi:hypothetical protein